MAPWPVRAAKALDRDENSRVVVENLDQIIRWITGRPSDTTSALDLETSKLGLEPGMARTRALVIINRMMLTRQDPWQALGVRRGTDLDEVRIRYKRLMQVFHPDRGFADSDWLSDCTARLHWAHDAIRKSPATRSGFTTGFGKRQRGVSKPPPWTHGSRAPKAPQPRSTVPEPKSTFRAEPDHAEAAQSVPQESNPASPEIAGVSSGVWQFPAPSQSSSDDHKEDEHYVQQQARRTTESVSAPQDGDFAQTHDVMAEDLATEDDHSDYDSVFESAIELEQAGSDTRDDAQVQEDTNENLVDIFEQASPLAYEINQDLDSEDDRVAARIQLKSQSDRERVTPHEPASTDEPLHDDDQLINQRVARAKEQQIAHDEARARQEQERLLEIHRQQQAEKEAAQAKVDAKAKKEHERSLKLEESRREKERRKHLKAERQLERKRDKELRKKEKTELKHRELQQQRLDAEAAEKKLKEERQRLRAEARHRAELEVEKRRLKELNELQRKEAEAFEAQKAREAERRRRHLNAEGNRLSSVSDRSPSELTSVSETTIPPWQEHLPDLTPAKRDDTTKNAITGNSIDSLQASDTNFSVARNRHAKIDNQSASSATRVSNVEHIRTAKDRLRAVPDGSDENLAGSEKAPRPRRSEGRDKVFDDDIFKPDANVRGNADLDELADTETDDSVLGANIGSERNRYAANDDSAQRPLPPTQARNVFFAAGVVGLICLAVLAVAVQKLMAPDDEGNTVAGTTSSSSNTVTDVEPVSDTAVANETTSAIVVDTDRDGSVAANTTSSSVSGGSRIVIDASQAQESAAEKSLSAASSSDIGDDAVSEVTTETSGSETAVIDSSDTTASGTEPKQLDIVINADSVTEAADTNGAALSSTESQTASTTVQSIAEPAIDRTPTTVAKTVTVDSTEVAASSELRGVNISSDPVANVQHIAEELGRRYMDGDADAFAALFAQDATMNGISGAAAIHEFHLQLFESTSARRAIIDIGQVDVDGADYLTRGRFSKVLRFTDGTSKLSDSTIALRVAQAGDRFVITALTF